MDPQRAPFYEALIWGGTTMTLVGLALLLWCIVKVRRARRHAPDDEALRAVLTSMIPYNLGALCLSALGLMSIVIGVLLG